MSRSKTIQVTKDYKLFGRNPENRPIDAAKHRKLLESMKLYGFLKCFPVVAARDASRNLFVKDGQHRLMFAETLGLPVYWVEEDVDFDVAVVNCAAKGWALKDYAKKHAANGLRPYAEGLEFSEQHGLPIGTAFALLAGQTGFSNIHDDFIGGKFKVKDRSWADAVAGLYGPMVLMAPAIKNARFIEACMMVCRVPDFDARRMVGGAERCREKLVPYANKESYLDMLESLYNFGRKQHVGLKAAAINAMKARNPAHNRNGHPKRANDAA
jgi:hypothetical protein